ncbi:MAG: nuclear transport factor 2 family protein [Chthoniobacterales bacterium]
MSKSTPKEKRGTYRPVVVGVAIFILLVVAVIGGKEWRASLEAGPDADSIREFIGRYFNTWSVKDMTGYGGCFDSSAMVYFIKDGRVVLRQDKPDFISGQTEAVIRGPASEEHPESIQIMAEGDLAYARVYWKMTRGSLVKRGYDHFTLLRTTQGWKIIALTFYETPAKE